MQKIIICPNEVKSYYLKKNNTLCNIKYMTINEFMSYYYYSYDEKALFYLRDKYKYHLDVCKVYLNNMYFIDINKNYKNDKLNFLKDLKKELIDYNLLIFNPLFKTYLNNKEIIVDGYYDLELYQEEILKPKVIIPDSKINNTIYAFDSMEEEVHFVCVKIRELLKKNIDINNIYLCNVDSSYYYILERLFSYYHIPINIDFSNTLYSTKEVQSYLVNYDINLVNNGFIKSKLINILSSLVEIDSNSFIYRELLIDKLKNTYIPNKKYKRAVNIKNIKDAIFSDEDYVFFLGFNQNSAPNTYKDIDYISDYIKSEVGLYTTDYLNKREKQVLVYLLSRIKNLTISYKTSSPFQKYYPSCLIDEYLLRVEHEKVNDVIYSDEYNKIRFAEAMDLYYTFGEKSSDLGLFTNHYKIPYNTYNHDYSGINIDNYHYNLKYPLRLSYTSLNGYNECSFKYYINNVLRLGEYEDTFAAFIGSLYHHVLSLYTKNNFNLDEEWNNYLEKRELNIKEKVLLVRIRKDLEDLLEVLKKQKLITGYDEEYYEREAKVTIKEDIAVEFIGYIDKIMFYKKIDDTYFSIIDYKTGSIDTHIETMKYGLHMQLPIYLYLINYSKIFDNPIFTGIYYQNILFSYPTWSKDLDNNLKDRYKLKGYSTDNIGVLSRFDSTYEDSLLIKSLKYSEEKGFSRGSKIIDDELLYKIIKYTKKHIENRVDDILKAKFDINPKVYGNENISCKYCKFNDICYMNSKDITYLDKVEDFSFLGGEE